MTTTYDGLVAAWAPYETTDPTSLYRARLAARWRLEEELEAANAVPLGVVTFRLSNVVLKLDEREPDGALLAEVRALRLTNPNPIPKLRLFGRGGQR
jgi:hypothetical protein